MTTMLENEVVRLRQMTAADSDDLWEVGQYPEIWQHMSIAPSSLEGVAVYVNNALAEKNCFPMVIIDVATNKIIGSTQYLNMDSKNQKAEIGYTWLTPSEWGTNININAKYLLLQYAFETWGLRRITIQTDSINERARKAIEAIGATYEGTLRNDRVRRDGSSRHTAVYSVIKEEWEQVKKQLGERCATKNV